MLKKIKNKLEELPESQRPFNLSESFTDISTGNPKITFFAYPKNWVYGQDNPIVYETTQHINNLLNQIYTHDSYFNLLARVMAELRGGMIYIAQLLEDAQFLREWEEKINFLPNFSMSGDDIYIHHAFLFKQFDDNPLYLLNTNDLKLIDIKNIDTRIEEINIKIKTLSETDEKQLLNKELDEKNTLKKLSDLDKHKWLLNKIIIKHMEYQKGFNVLDEFKYKKNPTISVQSFNRFKIVRMLMDPIYDKYTICDIEKKIIAEFNNISNESIEKIINKYKNQYVKAEIIRKDNIKKDIAGRSLNTEEGINIAFLRIFKEYLNLNNDNFKDDTILAHYNISVLYKNLNNKTDNDEILNIIIRYIRVQPLLLKQNKPFTKKPFTSIKYYENLKTKLYDEGFSQNVNNKMFNKMMDIIKENNPCVKNSNPLSNKFMLQQLKEDDIITARDGIVLYDNMMRYIEEYSIVDMNMVLYDIFLYEAFVDLGYIHKPTANSVNNKHHKLTSLDGLCSLYDLLSINGTYEFNTSFRVMCERLPTKLKIPDDNKLIEIINSINQYNKGNDIYILFNIIARQKQLLLGDRLTLLKFYANNNNNIYYTIYPVTRQPTNISVLLIKLFAHNNTHTNNKYPVRIILPENKRYLYDSLNTYPLNSYKFIGIMSIDIENNLKYILIYKKIFDLTQPPEYKFSIPTDMRYDFLTFVDPSLSHLISVSTTIYRMSNFNYPTNVNVEGGKVVVLNNIFYLEEPKAFEYNDTRVNMSTYLFHISTEKEQVSPHMSAKKLLKTITAKNPWSSSIKPATQGTSKKIWRPRNKTQSPTSRMSWRSSNHGGGYKQYIHNKFYYTKLFM